MNAKSKTALGILGGVAVGAAVGMLFAPAKGKDTRKKIKSNANDLKCKAEDGLNKLTKDAKEKLNTVSEKVSHTFKSNVDKAQNLVKKVETELDALK